MTTLLFNQALGLYSSIFLLFFIKPKEEEKTVFFEIGRIEGTFKFDTM